MIRVLYGEVPLNGMDPRIAVLAHNKERKKKKKPKQVTVCRLRATYFHIAHFRKKLYHIR